MRPQPLAGLGVVGHQITKLVALEDEARIGTEHTAIQRQRKRHGPTRLCFDRVPRQQRPAVQIGYCIERARGIFRRPARSSVVTNVPE